MSHDWIFDGNFFDLLDREDARIADAAKAIGCPHCAGRLDRADYPRKPRGGDLATAGETIERRRSLCCAREGCRKRLTPPSLVFLGRRVYLAIAVVIAAWRPTARRRSPPARTVRRWRSWFTTRLPATRWFQTVRARLSPPLEPGESLPGALIERLSRVHPDGDAVIATLRVMAPLSSAIGAG